MAAIRAEPLDEIQYRRPDIIDWWVSEGGRPMDENMIHRYFCESSFFDWTSKNGLLIDQSKSDWTTFQMVNNRHAFEANLKSRPGLEFLIVEEPKPVTDAEQAAQGLTTGIWVIRKQDRARAPDAPRVRPPSVMVEQDRSGKDRWELTILGTYFIVGEAVYQAPNVFDVVGNRLLNAANSLNKFFDTAGDLPRYSPAAGHHYLPRALRPAASTTSMPGTPSRSREGSLAPGEDTQSLRSGSVSAETQPSNGMTAPSASDSRLLLSSLEMAVRYGDEYVDENPLMGEPGNLRFTASTAAVKKRRADEEAAAMKARVEKDAASSSRAASPKVEKVTTPPAVFHTVVKTQNGTDPEKASKDERRGNKAGKKNRRKSRHGTTTNPTTPASATSNQAPNSALS